MKMLWYIAKKDLLQVLKDRNSFILLLIVPLMLITILGAALGNGFGDSDDTAAFTVAVSNKDDGFIGDILIKALKAKNSNYTITIDKYNNTSQVKKQVDNGQAVAGLVIPAQTTKSINKAASDGLLRSNIIQLYIKPNNTDERATIVQQIVTNILNRQVDTLYTGSAAVKQVTNAVKQIQQGSPEQCDHDTNTSSYNSGSANDTSTANKLCNRKKVLSMRRPSAKQWATPAPSTII